MLYQGSHVFSKYQIPGFLKVFGPKFQVFSSFFVPNFHTNFSYKNLEMSERQVHTSLVTQLISRLFPGKSNEIKGQFGFESVFVLIMNVDMTKYIRIIFVKDILKSEA